MSRIGNLINRLISGTTVVPDFVGRPWRETGVVAVRHRVVRQLTLADPRQDGEPLAGWIVEAQSPRAGERVPIGSNVTLVLAHAADRDRPGQPAPQGLTMAASRTDR